VPEAQAASKLNHPHIVTIHGIDCSDGIDFIVMELVAGKTLAAQPVLSRPGTIAGTPAHISPELWGLWLLPFGPWPTGPASFRRHWASC
jgi:hypothetical protein